MEEWIPVIANHAATYPVYARVAVMLIYVGCMVYVVRRIFPVN